MANCNTNHARVQFLLTRHVCISFVRLQDRNEFTSLLLVRKVPIFSQVTSGRNVRKRMESLVPKITTRRLVNRSLIMLYLTVETSARSDFLRSEDDMLWAV